LPAFNSSSVAGAGYNSKQPYLSSNTNNTKPSGGGTSLNNVFNIPKYGQGSGLGGGIGGGIGSYGSLGGGIGGMMGNPIGSAGSYNKQAEENEFGGRY
jgi:hypothetical protein